MKTAFGSLLAGMLLVLPAFCQADLTITGLNTAGVVTDTQSLAVSGNLVVSIRNAGTAPVTAPFQIVAWDDRDGNRLFNSGTDVTLGSLLYSSGLTAGASIDVSLPLSGTVRFRGNLIFVQVDAGNVVTELDKTNNIRTTGDGRPTDATASLITKNDSLFPNSVRLTARVGNGGGSAGLTCSRYDAATAFSIQGNPNGPWTYGYRLSTGSSFIPFQQSFTSHPSGYPNIPNWRAPSLDDFLGVYRNDANFVQTADGAHWSPGTLILHPGNGGQISIIRWTAAVTGTWRLVGSFFDAHQATTGVRIIRRDGTVLASGGISPGSRFSFDQTVTFNAGDYVEFAVDYGPNLNYARDSTGLDLTIEQGCNGAAATGRAVIAHDVNILSTSLAGTQESTFALNVARWLTHSTAAARLLLIQSNTGDSTRDYSTIVLNALQAAGYQVTVTSDYTWTSAELRSFDAIFTTKAFPIDQFIDNQALIDYLKSGRGIYLSGGVGQDPLVEANGWSVFLGALGLAFDQQYNQNYIGTPVGGHPIFENVTFLNSGNGSNLLVLTSGPALTVFGAKSALVFATYDAELTAGSRGGRIVVGHDANTLGTNLAGASETSFAVNVARWLTEGRTQPKLLDIELNPTDPDHNFSALVKQAWTTNGFSLTVSNSVSWTLPQFVQYDGIFIHSSRAGAQIDNTLLVQYVSQGGGVYIAGGVGPFADGEAALWAPFLASIGLAFQSSGYNNLFGAVAVGGHPIFAGVSQLASSNGQDIVQPTPNQSVQLFTFTGHNVYATYERPSISGPSGLGPNIVQNGDFEAPVPPPNNGPNTSLSDRNPADIHAIPYWTLFGEVDVAYGAQWITPNGNQSIDLNSYNPGALEQAIVTKSGSRYRVHFLLAGNPEGAPAVKMLRVSAAGQSQVFSFDVTGHSFASMGWTDSYWDFTANGTSTQLRFESWNTPGPYGPVIDAVETREILGQGVAVGISVAFYRGDPASGGTLIGTTSTSRALNPGEYEDVSVIWKNPPAGLHPIVVVADDDGAGHGAISEIDETNNKAGANILLGIGPFVTVDDLTARFKDKSVDIRWGAVPGATGYNVYRRSGTGSPARIRAGGTSTAFSDLNLTDGTVYYYSVRWLNAQGLESGDGTEASATPDAILAQDSAPTILSVPVVRAFALALYRYQVRAGDPDFGDVLVYSLQSPPVGMSISTTGLISWTPTTTQGGYTRIQVRVTDSRGRFSTQSYALFTDVQNINAPPIITSTPITLATSGALYGYQVLGRDPENGLLFYRLDTAPAGMSINQSSGLIQWVPTRSQLGNQSVTVRATDFGGLFVTQSFTIAVARGNQAPQFTSVPIVNAEVGQRYSYQALATDPETDPITFSLAAGPTGMTMSTTGLVQWTPTADQLGAQSISLRVADDSGANALQNYVVTVRPPNHPPAITSTPVTTAAVAALYSYQVTASDADLPNDGLTYSLTVAPAGMSIAPNTGLIQWTPAANFTNTNQSVTVQVTDLSGAIATQPFVVHVNPQDLQRPTVSLSSLVNGAVITADVPIIGSVQDNNLTLWRVEYQPAGAANWLTLATGTSTVNNGQLAILPATLLANDVYRIRLYAQDNGGSVTTPEIEVQVNTQQLKMGDFTLRFEDLRIPGFTFPISILRKYDSKRPGVGDFGPGWTLGFSEVAVRVDVKDNVFLTLPDGRRVSFQFTPIPIGFGVVNTAFAAQGGVYDTLENLDCPQVFGSPGSWLCNGFQSWQPTNWRLKTKDGLTYTIADSSITRIEDRAGNWIQIASTGITSNTGRNVSIERNAQNLVTRIVAPPTGVTPGGDLRYLYDSQGRLVTFLDQNSKATTFAYENAAFPHYLTKITDPLGRQLVRNVFNAQGQLVAQCDPNGNINTLAGCSQFNPQPGTKTFTAINGRGFRTDLISDDRGNVLSERRFLDAINYLETVRTYDANNNTLTERDPEGNLRTYTYDSRGNRLSETDPGGRTTRYTYDPNCDKLTTITDAAGNVTTNTYDAQCNLRFVRDALNKTTEYRYSGAGQRMQMIDSNGTTWTWAYSANALLQSVTDPFGKATTFTFDNKGNLLSRTDRNGRRIDFQYDTANRLTRETWSNGRISSFNYDDAGSLLSATDPDSSLSMAYDNLGRLLSVDNLGTPGAPRVLVTYSYDANGNTTRVQDSLGGSTDYTYDALDRLSRVTQSGAGVQPKRVDMSYSTASILTQLKRFADVPGTIGVANTSYEYDCGGCPGRLTAIRHRKASDNSVIHDLTFVRDALGNIISSTDAEGAHSYTYDAVRRLTSAAHPVGGVQPNESYTYDAVGNRLTSHLSPFYTYSWQTQGTGNRLLQDNQFDYSYDDEGNLTRKTDRASSAYTAFIYDYRGRLTSVSQRTSAGAETGRSDYVYDVLNRRIRSVEVGQTSFFSYDGLNPLLKLGASSSLISRRMYGKTLDSILADEAPTGLRWFLLDQIGTVRDLLGSTGVPNHYRYDSFGRLLMQSDPSVVNDLLFAGREGSSSTGLEFARARWYDAARGTFNREDQIEPYSYQYAGQSPVAYVDKFGLFQDYAGGLTISARATIGLQQSGALIIINLARTGLFVSGTAGVTETALFVIDLGRCVAETSQYVNCFKNALIQAVARNVDPSGQLRTILEVLKLIPIPY